MGLFPVFSHEHHGQQFKLMEEGNLGEVGSFHPQGPPRVRSLF